MNLGVATAVVLAVGLLAAPVARADHDDDWRYGPRDTFGIGYSRGLDEGLEDGEKDGRKHRRFDFAQHSEYRHGDHGYKGHYGPRHLYASGFRRGFEEGYRRAYQAYAGGYGYYRGRDGYGDGYGYGYGRDGYARPRYEGRHRHPGSDRWCYERHDGRDDDDRIIYEVPRRW